MDTKIIVDNVSFTYGLQKVFENISCTFAAGEISAITGPSGAGKSTFLRLFNRLWEEQGAGCVSGRILLNLRCGQLDIHDATLPVLRRKVGMVFQTPNPLPMSIAANVAFPLQLAGEKQGKELRRKVEEMLDRVHLLDEVHDRLDTDARLLSGGQQQRLCLARALMLEPEILLLDEPTSSLDAVACEAVESLLLGLKATTTLVLVSHYHDQVQRIADCVYELAGGRLSTLV